jgi:hypothetical protein
MPIFPAVILASCTGYYLLAIADLIDTALALATPADISSDRRRKFRVIEGGKPLEIGAN